MMQPYSLVFGMNTDTGELEALPLSLLTHAHFKGMTGHGKSSLLVHLVTSLIVQGVGVTLVDPAGDLSRQVLAKLVHRGFFDKTPDAYERVVYLDVPRAQREDRYFPMNVLSGDYDAYTAANVVLEGYKRIWPNLQDGTSTNIETLLKIGAYVLADFGLPFLPYFEELYTNADVQDVLLSHIHDQQIRRQFETLELRPVTKDGRSKLPEIASTSLKREYLLSFSPVVRYSLSQQDNLLDFGKILDSEHPRSVLVNLRLADPDAKRLIGCLITEQLEAAAKSRGNVPGEQRRKHVLVIDEVQNFIYQSGLALENLFAEARRAGVAVWVAHQYGAQLSETLNSAISQCNIKVVFKLKDFEDAMVSVKQTGFPMHTHKVKQALGNMFTPAGEHYQFYSDAEQWTQHALTITQLPPREAFLELPSGRLVPMTTLDVEPLRDTDRLMRVEDEMLRRHFRTRADIDRDVEKTLAQVLALSIKKNVAKDAQPAEVRPVPAPPAKPRSAQPKSLKPARREELGDIVDADDTLKLPENEDDLY